MSRQGILKASMVYVPSQIVVMLTAIVRSLVLPKILMPDHYGELAAVLLIVNYSRLANLGVLNEYDREYPRALAVSSENDRLLYRDTCFSLFVLHNLIYAVIFGVLYAWKQAGQSAWIYLFFFACLIADNINEFVVDTYRAHRQFAKIAVNRISLNFLNMTLSVIGAIRWGLQGALVGIGLGYCLSVIFFLTHSDRPSLRIDTSRLRSIYSSGLSLIAVLGLSMFLDSYDRLTVSLFFKGADMGVYSLGHSMARLILFIFVSTTYVIYPFLLSMHAKDGDTTKLNHFYQKIINLISIIAPLALACIYFSLNIMVPLLLPKYEASLVFLPLLMVAMFFSILSQITDTFLLILNRQNAIFRNQSYTAISLSIVIGIIYFSARDLRSVASLFALGYAVYFSLAWLTLATEFKNQLVPSKQIFTGSIFAVLGGCGGMLLPTVHADHRLLINLIALVSITTITALAAFWVDHKTGLVREVIIMVRLKFLKAPQER